MFITYDDRPDQVLKKVQQELLAKGITVIFKDCSTEEDEEVGRMQFSVDIQ